MRHDTQSFVHETRRNSQAEGNIVPLHLEGDEYRAFTLAEVLITLGIIGVVAALTLPTLIQSYRKHVVETKLAKVYSVVNQAIKLSEVEYGNYEGWNFLECGTSTNATCTLDESVDWFKEYIGKNLKYSKIEKDEAKQRFYVYFDDGGILNIASYLRDMNFITDTKALDNIQPGRNSFLFRLYTPQQLAVPNFDNLIKYHKGKTFEPYMYGWNGTREQLIHSENPANYGCEDSIKSYCTKLIQQNGWKIPDDYPVKF